jgi:hypothetical protein
MKREVSRAEEVYRGFREATPKRARVVRVVLPKAVAIIGPVRAIEYDTKHGRKAVPYRHKFAAGSAPLLVAAPDGRIFLLEGRYHFTDRGIVDLDAAGREIEDGRRRK